MYNLRFLSFPWVDKTMENLFPRKEKRKIKQKVFQQKLQITDNQRQNDNNTP